jgi:hypothetical protein
MRCTYKVVRITPESGHSAYRRGEMLAKRHKLMADWQAFCDGKVKPRRSR